jgi:hypothetical protein
MAEKKEEKVKDARAERWAEHVAAYKKKNPAKFAIKEKRGEFANIPASFQ